MKILILACLIAGAFAWGDAPDCGESMYADAGVDQGNSKIVGGWEARQNEFPYQVNLQRTAAGSQFCGGVFVDTNYAITAAHCVSGSSAANVFVVLGCHTRDCDEGNRIGVRQIDVHEDYNPIQVANDVAVLHLDSSQGSDDSQRTACRPENNGNNEQSVVSGWGTLSYGGPSAQNLMYTVVEIISLDECRQTNYNPGSIMDGMLCAGQEGGGRDACQGDSGGPLTVKYGSKFQVHGLTSWGYECATDGYPGVYADVFYYNSWFDAIMG